MILRSLLRKARLPAAVGLIGITLLLPGPAPAQEEVADALRRYKDREVSTGFYEEHEVKPRRMKPFIKAPREAPPQRPFPYSSTAGMVRNRTYLADSHAGIQFYEHRRCEECHVTEAKHSHTVRGNVTCRQCHGAEPIAGINYYFSPMNPIRRHAYVCAKCHEGANPSFATFLVHEPPAGASQTRKIFPSLFYTNWFMYILIVGTLGFFGLHTLIWMSKESYHAMKEKMGSKPEAKAAAEAENIEAQEPKPEADPDPKEEPERGQKNE
jgi:hypothetical protein